MSYDGNEDVTEGEYDALEAAYDKAVDAVERYVAWKGKT